MDLQLQNPLLHGFNHFRAGFQQVTGRSRCSGRLAVHPQTLRLRPLAHPEQRVVFSSVTGHYCLPLTP